LLGKVLMDRDSKKQDQWVIPTAGTKPGTGEARVLHTDSSFLSRSVLIGIP
jgi:hypothetical protein